MKHILRLCITILLLALCFYILPVHGEAALYDNIIRLHVLANSDTTDDQTLKLYVRDAILAAMPDLIGQCRSRQEAADILATSLPALTQIAQDTLLSYGCSDPVEVTLCTEFYPTRSYESLCFPGGRYLSLQVRIGNAVGQNWWCVLFPTLCLSAASKKEAEQAFLAVGFTPEQYRVITESDQNETYKLRFKFLEILQGLLP